MLKRPIEGTKGPAQTALLMITQQQMKDNKKHFAAGQTTASVDAWALGMENSAVLVGVWEDHGVGVDLEFDSSENYAEAHRSAATQVAGAAGLSRT